MSDRCWAIHNMNYGIDIDTVAKTKEDAIKRHIDDPDDEGPFDESRLALMSVVVECKLVIMD